MGKTALIKAAFLDTKSTSKLDSASIELAGTSAASSIDSVPFTCCRTNSNERVVYNKIGVILLITVLRIDDPKQYTEVRVTRIISGTTRSCVMVTHR